MGKRDKKKDDKVNTAALKKADRAEKKRVKKELHRKRDYESSEETQFARELLSEGYIIKYIDMDGNCMFRSICDQLFGDPSRHMELRGRVLDYIEQHETHFSLFIEDDESFEDYLSRMRTQAEWGGHQELYAASQLLNVNIHVHQLGASRFLLPAPSSGSKQDSSFAAISAAREIHLSYHGEFHYNSLHPADGAPLQSSSSATRDSELAIGHDEILLTPSHHAVVFDQVALSVPWASHQDIHSALRQCNFDLGETVEKLISGEHHASSTLSTATTAHALLPEEEDGNHHAATLNKEPTAKKPGRLSKKEKRLMKKGKPLKPETSACSSDSGDADGASSAGVIVL